MHFKAERIFHANNATPEDRSGVSTFQVGDSQTLTMPLASFADHQSVCALMEAAWRAGVEDAKYEIIDRIGRITR